MGRKKLIIIKFHYLNRQKEIIKLKNGDLPIRIGYLPDKKAALVGVQDGRT